MICAAIRSSCARQHSPAFSRERRWACGWHLEADGPDVFHHACKLGLEGIVSKRKDSRYKSGRSPDWIKSKNPNAPAVRREAEEDWGRWPTRRPNDHNR